MPRQIVHTSGAPQPPRTYSQAVLAGALVFVSGTGPYDLASGAIVGTTNQQQGKRNAADDPPRNVARPDQAAQVQASDLSSTLPERKYLI
ncbi:RidA family protein [Roseateles sp. GG27B]